MFTVGMHDVSRCYFSLATLVIGVPTAVKIFAWSLGMSATTFHDWTRVCALAFIGCFVFGGFTGLVLANATIDLVFHDTYFVVGHFHYVLSIAAAIGFVIVFLRFFETVAFFRLRFFFRWFFIALVLFSINSIFLLQHTTGIEGHPRRVFLSPEIYVATACFSNIGIAFLVLLIFNFW